MVKKTFIRAAVVNKKDAKPDANGEVTVGGGFYGLYGSILSLTPPSAVN
jgi:hypothetical protein